MPVLEHTVGMSRLAGTFSHLRSEKILVDGWRPVVISDELYERAREYYEENKEELRLRDGIRSLTGFINFCIREHLKGKGII